MKDQTTSLILSTCISLFNQKGCRFTLDDVVEKSGISRKTFYVYFSSKDEILKRLIDDYHKSIKEEQDKIISSSLCTLDKLHSCLTIQGSHAEELDEKKIYEMERYAPEVYKYMMDVYEKDWDKVEVLIKRGIKEGIFKKTKPDFVKSLLQKGMEMFYQGDFLKRNNLTYQKALEQLADLVIDGLKRRD